MRPPLLKFGISFMNKDWDKIDWKTGSGMAKVGIGQRAIPWPSHGGANPFGGANPTCGVCGGRLRGAVKCSCDEPAWFVDGEPVEDGAGMGSTKALEHIHAQQAWHLAWLKEAFRVLRPGGVVKAFSATRTFHRLVAAMVEAGFRDVKLEAWCYGCLPEDTEILTDRGWIPGVEVREGSQVACWDPETGEIALRPVEKVFLAPYRGKLVKFKNDNTDQALTPNHRVYKKSRIRKMTAGIRKVWEEESWNVAEAGAINRWNAIRLPLAGKHSGPGIGGVDKAALLAWIWTEGGFDIHGTGVRIHQSSVNQEYVDEIQGLLDRMVPEHKHYHRARTYKGHPYTEHCWFFTGPSALWARSVLPSKHPTWNLLWAMTEMEKEVFVDAALKGDGSVAEGKTRKDGTAGPNRKSFWQKNAADLEWFQTLAHLMDRQGRVNLRKSCMTLHFNAATQLQKRHLREESEDYAGQVWCVQVPTGAFVARRNGQIFITGNSGFPKSLNISKALDRQQGAEPKIVGVRMGKGGENLNSLTRPAGNDTANAKSLGAYGVGAKQVNVPIPVTEPVSELAKKWDGWGTALKPAWEPFVVGRKPE